MADYSTLNIAITCNSTQEVFDYINENIFKTKYPNRLLIDTIEMEDNIVYISADIEAIITIMDIVAIIMNVKHLLDKDSIIHIDGYDLAHSVYVSYHYKHSNNTIDIRLLDNPAIATLANDATAEDENEHIQSCIQEVNKLEPINVRTLLLRENTDNKKYYAHMCKQYMCVMSVFNVLKTTDGPISWDAVMSEYNTMCKTLNVRNMYRGEIKKLYLTTKEKFDTFIPPGISKTDLLFSFIKSNIINRITESYYVKEDDPFTLAKQLCVYVNNES